MAYRFRKQEIEDMKNNILGHCENEQEHEGNYSAWRLGWILHAMVVCTTCGKREYAKRRRELHLYESLTKDHKPNWN